MLCFSWYEYPITRYRKSPDGQADHPYWFTWREVEARSDLERLRLVFDHIGDGGLMRKLEEHRKWGRDDYPIRAVWNSVLAGIVYQHGSVDSLRRELWRNGELRDQCGFDPQRGSGRAAVLGVYEVFEAIIQIDTGSGWDV